MTSTVEPTTTPKEASQEVAAPEESSEDVNTTKVGVLDDEKAQAGKKKKKRSKAKKKGTGFEEFYCDPPMAPAEYNEERDVIYPAHRPFADRIEECIQRFRARRRLDPERENLFSNYLVLGGIDATTRQFQSSRKIDDEILADATKSAVREMTADDVIQRGVDGNNNPRFYNPNYPEHWDVDFTGVVAGFFSEHIMIMAGPDMEVIRKGVDVVLNFLRYVEQHDVCPEYADDIKQAQKVCFRVLEEVPAIKELHDLMPGHFNTALRVLHAKDEDDGSSSSSAQALPDSKQAQISHAATLSILKGPSRGPTDPEWSVTETTELTYEIMEIKLPNGAIQAKYKAINQHLTGYPDIQACGTIVAWPVIIRDGWDNSATSEIPRKALVKTQFILEEGILRLLRVGMKLTMTVCTLNVGLQLIKSVKEIRPSYYVFLPQELMLHYKAPVPSGRPAPSIHDFDDGEGALAGDEVDGQDD